MLRDDTAIADLCQQLDLDLDNYNYQFLWLVPIIEVMWADGRCQKEEVETLFHYVEVFVKRVNPDVPQITMPRARRFFMPLLKPSAVNDPSKRMLLSQLVDQIIQGVVEPARQDKKRHLFHICHEVAAAARVNAADTEEAQVSQEEERLLRNLVKDLRLESVGR